MTATILAFPHRPRRADNALLIGQHIRDSYCLPSRDAELALLMEEADRLLSNLSDDGLCDRFLDRLDQWERDNQAG